MSNNLVIIPAYNEEKNIARVLRELKALKMDVDMLVVNDGSLDQTVSIVHNEGVQLITLPYNLGYGGALQTGFKYAVAKGYQYVVHLDADGQHHPEDLKSLLDSIINQEMDIVIGSRFLGKGTIQTGFMKKLAIKTFRLLIKMSTGKVITDPSSGYQALSRGAFRYYATMGHYPQDYPDADVLIHMLNNGFRVCEIPVKMRERENGTSMHSGLKPVYYLVKMIVSIIVVLLRGKTITKDGAVDG